MISHEHQVIFVHIPKTAGQSVEQAFLADLSLSWDERETLLLRRNPDPARGPRFLSHLYGQEYVALGHVTPDQFAAYFKFAVVRHPMERFLSEYRYRNPSGRVSLADFLDRRPENENLNAARHAVPQHRYAYDGDKLLLDQVLRFETLAQEWPALSERLFGRLVPLTHANRGRQTPTAVDVDPDLRSRIEDRYRRDYELFGYELAD